MPGGYHWLWAGSPYLHHLAGKCALNLLGNHEEAVLFGAIGFNPKAKAAIDWTKEQLYCTPEGQVLLMKNERSAFEINVGIERSFRKQRQAAWAKLKPDQRRALVRQTIGSNEDPILKPKVSKGEHAIHRNGYRIEKLILAGNENQLALPGLLFIPEKISRAPVLYLHGVSMKTDAQPDGPCEQLAKAGHIVLAAELSGIGETETGHDKRDYGRGRFGRDCQEITLAYLIGRSKEAFVRLGEEERVLRDLSLMHI